jgi:mannose-6-phosphate isomerase-like protein (cupin superfamily)
MYEATRASVLYLLALSLPSLSACARESASPLDEGVRPAAYHANIVDLARGNDAYRRVLFTGAQTQTVLMSIPPGTDVGEESHARVEQILFSAGGAGEAVVDGVRSPFLPGDVVVVPPGTHHDFFATGEAPLKIYTIYAPPNHLPGRVQATKADAEADVEDEAFGRKVEAGEIVGP